MKVRIKKTGEIVNLASYATLTLDMYDSWGNPIEMKPEEIELIQDKTDDFDWKSFRAEATKDILCAMIGEVIKQRNGSDLIDNTVRSAIVITDNLISKLKEKEEK